MRAGRISRNAGCETLELLCVLTGKQVHVWLDVVAQTKNREDEEANQSVACQFALRAATYHT